MGLLDAWSRRATQRREGRVEFLGEQSGSVEDLIKRDLTIELFRRRFAREIALDILFLTAEQEAEIARVCSPFFSRAG